MANGRLLPALSPWWVLGMVERGRVVERRWKADREGDTGLLERARAAECYRFVAVVWRNADPELQPRVAEARAGLERLGPSTGTQPGRQLSRSAHSI